MRRTNQHNKTYLTTHLPDLQCRQITKSSECLSELPLSETDFNVLQCFLQRGRELTPESKKRLLYRGERKDALGNRLCQDPQAPLDKIAGALFYFGEKGKHFWDSSLRREGDNPPWPKILENLKDFSIESFRVILSNLRRIFVCFADKAGAFMGDNPEFHSAVSADPEVLIRRFETVADNEKRLVRDTYLYVLHTFSRKELKVYTPFVSFTPVYKTARLYSRLQNSKLDCNSCVICAFLPTSFEHQAMSSSSLKESLPRLEALGFPSVNGGFFKEEEVAFWGGAFPHCIYGIYQPKQIHLCVNPRALTPDLEDKVWEDGFAINQDDFESRILKETKYSCGVERSDSDMKELEFNVDRRSILKQE